MTKISSKFDSILLSSTTDIKFEERDYDEIIEVDIEQIDKSEIYKITLIDTENNFYYNMVSDFTIRSRLEINEIGIESLFGNITYIKIYLTKPCMVEVNSNQYAFIR